MFFNLNVMLLLCLKFVVCLSMRTGTKTLLRVVSLYCRLAGSLLCGGSVFCTQTCEPVGTGHVVLLSVSPMGRELTQRYFTYPGRLP